MDYDNTWVYMVETDIYTILKHRLMSRLSSKYPSINITQRREENTDAIFPTVYIHFLPSIEIGQDLTGITVNGIISTIEYTITVNAEQGFNAAREIAGCILTALKELAFQSIASAEIRNVTQSTVDMVGRARRTIGQGDSFE